MQYEISIQISFYKPSLYTTRKAKVIVKQLKQGVFFIEITFGDLGKNNDKSQSSVKHPIPLHFNLSFYHVLLIITIIID